MSILAMVDAAIKRHKAGCGESGRRQSFLPRLLHRTHAFMLGYFWVACPLCGDHFGGHEWKANFCLPVKEGTWGGSCFREEEGVCPACETDAREGRLRVERDLIIQGGPDGGRIMRVGGGHGG